MRHDFEHYRILGSGNHHMNLFDYFILVTTGYMIVRGIFRGIIKEFSSIIGVFAAFLLALAYYIDLSDLLGEWFSNTDYLNIIGFFIIFCGVLIFVSILASVIKYFLNISFLGWVDRLLGLGFGLLKSVLIVSVVMFVLTTFLTEGAGLIKNSKLAPHVAEVSEKMLALVPEELETRFIHHLDIFKKAWQEGQLPQIQ